MNKTKKSMLDFIEGLIKHKDSFLRQIESIERDKEGFDLYVKYKTKEQGYFAIPHLENVDDVLSNLHPDKHVSLIVLNNEHNLKFVMNNWKKFIGFRFFSIYFINPFSNIDKKWIIFPFTHDRIKDDASFEAGMKSMAENVDEITEEDMESNLK